MLSNLTKQNEETMTQSKLYLGIVTFTQQTKTYEKSVI